VDPRDGWPNTDAEKMSSGATWILDQARLTATTEQALRDAKYVLASTARPRDMEKPVLGPREAMAILREHARAGRKTAILFGPERTGLENAEIMRADAIVTLPISPRFPSLNLAQAIATLVYEWRVGEGDAPPAKFDDQLDEPATQEELEGLFLHIEAEADASGFYRPPEKADIMKRNIRNALLRARFTDQEVRTLRGLVKSLAHWRGDATGRTRREDT
jgi:tRNA/rRNA methyltransferase